MPNHDARGQVSYERILAVKLADLGDLLTVTPALQALRAAHPGAQIDLLAPPSSAGLLRGAPYVERVITFDKFAFDSPAGLLDLRKLARTLQLLLQLRASRYDALLLFHHFTTLWGTIKFAILARAAGARVRAGLDNGRGRFLTLAAPDAGFGAMHEADYWLSVVGLIGADPSRGWRPNIPIDESDRSGVTKLLADLCISRASPLVVIHPGAGAYGPARIWPLEGFAIVAQGLISSHGAIVAIVGGPDEIGRGADLESLIDRDGHVFNLAGRTSIHEAAALIERCHLFVGNDSGPMHLAAAVGTPVVAIFGPSNQGAWGPYTPPGEQSLHKIVARDLPCMPCFYRVHSLGLREGCGPRPCLTELPAERVLEACRETLDVMRDRKQSAISGQRSANPEMQELTADS